MGNTEKGQDREPVVPRVTLRCLTDDLGYSTADAERPIGELESDVVKKFLAMRSQEPRGTEKVHPLTNAQEIYLLHADEWRGATWHDREHDGRRAPACSRSEVKSRSTVSLSLGYGR